MHAPLNFCQRYHRDKQKKIYKKKNQSLVCECGAQVYLIQQSTCIHIETIESNPIHK